MFAADPKPDGSLVLWDWWPMPFANSTRVTLVNTTAATVPGIAGDVTTTPDAQWAAALASGRAGYFTARAHAGPTIQGQDWVFADEQGHGKFVGVSHTIRGQRTKTAFSDGAPYFLEGAERVYTDGAASPQWYGTGTEDLYEGGWYFKDGTHFSDPLNGQPDQRTATGGCADYCVAVYRIMLADAIGYHSALRFGIEHGKRNMVQPDYSSTAFLYTQPDAVLTGSDDVRPADPVDRVLHGYTDADATDQLLVSEYEGTEDTLPSSARSAAPRARSRSMSRLIRATTVSCCAARRTRRRASNRRTSRWTACPRARGFSRAATPFTAGWTTPTWCRSRSPRAKRS